METEYFTHDGHLTPQALQALVDGTVNDEERRLELAEHLSFCDECLTQYTLLLTDEKLQAPSSLLQDSVMQRIRSRGRSIVLQRIAQVAAAVALTVGLWAGGGHMLTASRPPTAPPQPTQETTVREKADTWLGNMTGYVNTVLFGKKASTPPVAPSKVPERPLTPSNKASNETETTTDDASSDAAGSDSTQNRGGRN